MVLAGQMQPDGLSLVTWQAGKPLSWDVTVVCPLADLYVVAGAREAGSAAEAAAARKSAKYTEMASDESYFPANRRAVSGTNKCIWLCIPEKSVS